MLGPSARAIASKRVPGKEFGPSARFIPWPYGKPGATLIRTLVSLGTLQAYKCSYGTDFDNYEIGAPLKPKHEPQEHMEEGFCCGPKGPRTQI